VDASLAGIGRGAIAALTVAGWLAKR